MTNFTRRTTMKAIAASAVLAPLPVTASTDGKVAALVAEYRRLGDEAQAAVDRADDLLFTLPADVRVGRVTLIEPQAPMPGVYAHSLDEVSDHYAACMRRAETEGTPAGFTTWAAWYGPEEHRARFDPPSNGTVKAHGDEAKRLFMDHLERSRVEKMAEMERAEAAAKEAKDKAGVTQAEAEAQALWDMQDETLRQIIATHSGGPRDLCAKLDLTDPGNGSSWPDWPEDETEPHMQRDLLKSLRRDFDAITF